MTGGMFTPVPPPCSFSRRHWFGARIKAGAADRRPWHCPGLLRSLNGRPRPDLPASCAHHSAHSGRTPARVHGASLLIDRVLYSLFNKLRRIPAHWRKL